MGQLGHLKGLNSEWNLKWVFKLPFSLNDLLQIWHMKGFAPIWVLKWTWYLLSIEYFLLQPGNVHEYGR